MHDLKKYRPKTYVGKAGTIAKKEFGIFETMLFRENSEKLEPQIRKNLSRPNFASVSRSQNLAFCNTYESLNGQIKEAKNRSLNSFFERKNQPNIKFF